MRPAFATLLEQLRHACSVALGDLICLGMPEGTDTSTLLKEAITRAEHQLSTEALDAGTGPGEPTPPTQIRTGDTLYAVGPGHHVPQGASDLRVYRASVRDVRLEGSYSAGAPPELLASATHIIELDDTRPVLGFPKGAYRSHEVGINVHLSETAALRVFAQHARQRRDVAAGDYNRANEELRWALTTETSHRGEQS